MHPPSLSAKPWASEPLPGFTKPFSPEEIAQIQALCDRLRGELLAMLEHVPRSGRSSLALARDLNLNRNVCQRVTEWLSCGLEPVESLTKLPSPEGVQMFVAALLHRTGRSGVQVPLLTAANAFERFVIAAAGSRASLMRRVEATLLNRASDPGGDNLACRKIFFDAATQLNGHCVDTTLSITLLRPMPQSPDFIEGVNAHGLIGVRSLASPVSLVSLSHYSRNVIGDLAHEMKTVPLAPPREGGPDHGSSLLLREFCSDTLPPESVDLGEGVCRTVIEPDPLQQRGAVDVVRGSRWFPDVHPALQPDLNYYCSLSIRRPSRRMVFDAYLHRSMAAKCVPSTAAYYFHPGLTGNPTRHWNDRLPGKTPLEVLGVGGSQARADAWPRYADLSRRIFELAGWPADEFVGFRCDVSYPIWSGMYYMMFDFSSSRDTP